MTLCWKSFRALLIVGSAIAALSPLGGPLHAQQACSDPGLNHLQHPPGTQTAPLGQLGRVDKVGTGPIPMILIPGAAFGGGAWKSFMEQNRDAYTMYAITPPGYDGTSPPPWSETADFSDRGWTNALCDAIVRLIDEEKLNRPVIVGHHMLGDHYALRIALDHPDKVRGVVIISGTPSMAFPAMNANAPGKPVSTATPDQRVRMVKGFWAPFYKTVTQKMWNAGSFQARTFCRNASRANQLYDQQVAVPIPTQVRYFLEYMTDDLEPRLEKLQRPLLVLLPNKTWTLDAALSVYRESNEMMYGDAEKAKSAWSTNMALMWGDTETGVKWMYDAKFRWERLRGVVPRMTIEIIDDSETFIMEDQPAALDRNLRAFVGSL